MRLNSHALNLSLIAMTDSSLWSIDCHSEADTDALGQRLGQVVEAGTVIAMTGNLGAGKTRFVQAATIGLGVTEDDVSSPTFVLIREYAGRLPVYHFDTYRLRDVDEFNELGATDYLFGDGVCFVEWAERVTDVLPRDRLDVVIEVTGERSRRFQFRSHGPRSRSLLARLKSEAKCQSD